MKVNEVRVLDFDDFRQIQQLCDDHTGWTLVYNKKKNNVWTKLAPESGLLMFKAQSVFPDVPGSVAYDVLQDPGYRSKWDKYMIASKNIGILNPNNDLCYYALSAFPPIRGRDFVMQRSWLDAGKEKYICGHSVCHDDFPPQKGLIRGTIYLTGYFIRELGENECEVTYITHSDPKGKLPTWFITRVTKAVAPKALKKLHKTCQSYPAWKNKHEPHFKPWIYPEQLQAAPRINLEQCCSRVYEQKIVDESSFAATNESKYKDSDTEDV